MRLLREPLVHFTVLGTLIFAAHAWLSEGDIIRVTPGVLSELRAGHLQRTGAAATTEQEAALVRQWVEDEMLLREAYQLGLERSDPVVRRRLITTMRFFMESGAATEPSREELDAFIRENSATYTPPMRYSFAHRFFHSEEAATAALTTGAAGESFLHGNLQTARTAEQLGARFGSALVAALESAPINTWHGPVRSSFGYHLVELRERRASPGAFERKRARADWRHNERDEVRRAAIERLRTNYRVEVDG